MKDKKMKNKELKKKISNVNVSVSSLCIIGIFLNAGLVYVDYIFPDKVHLTFYLVCAIFSFILMVVILTMLISALFSCWELMRNEK